MADTLDLTGEIANGINSAAARGHAVVVGYVGDDDYAALSFRGSTQVLSRDQLAIWSRRRDTGMVSVIADRPSVSLLYYEPNGPGPRYLSIHGQARVDESINDTVYEAMIEGERKQDPDRKGVAIVIDVVSVNGFGANGPFQMVRG